MVRFVVQEQSLLGSLSSCWQELAMRTAKQGAAALRALRPPIAALRCGHALHLACAEQLVAAATPRQVRRCFRLANVCSFWCHHSVGPTVDGGPQPPIDCVSHHKVLVLLMVYPTPLYSVSPPGLPHNPLLTGHLHPPKRVDSALGVPQLPIDSVSPPPQLRCPLCREPLSAAGSVSARCFN
jgi:hypothetical protein